MLAVAALGFVVRISFQAVVGFETPPVDDASQFDTVAWSVSQGGEFVTPGGVHSSRAPGYSYLLAGVYFVFGHNWPAARMIQALLGAATCAVLVSLGSRLYDATTGVIAGTTYALFPYAVFWSATLLSEPLCTLLALVATWLLLRAENQGWGWMAAWSVACGLTTLTRPNLALLFVFGLPLVLFRHPHRGRRGLYVTVIFLLVLLPWTVRNYVVHHRLVLDAAPMPRTFRRPAWSRAWTNRKPTPSISASRSIG